MTKWHLLWLAISFAASFGANRALEPRVEHPLSPGDRTLATGTLRLERGSSVEEIKVVTVFVVAHDLPRVLAEPLRVRELMVRSPEQSEGQEPDVELFFDFGAQPGPPIAVDARDIGALRERDLPLLPVAVASESRSRVRFPGAAEPAFAREGKLRIVETLDLDQPDGGTWRIEGEVQLVLSDGEGERTVKGTLSARLTW